MFAGLGDTRRRRHAKHEAKRAGTCRNLPHINRPHGSSSLGGTPIGRCRSGARENVMLQAMEAAVRSTGAHSATECLSRMSMSMSVRRALSPEYHIGPQKEAARRPPRRPVLIFTHLWGIVMVNVVAGAGIDTEASTM
jgi:hypothetical protein